jgi:hypothetical protein
VHIIRYVDVLLRVDVRRGSHRSISGRHKTIMSNGPRTLKYKTSWARFKRAQERGPVSFRWIEYCKGRVAFVRPVMGPTVQYGTTQSFGYVCTHLTIKVSLGCTTVSTTH